MSMSNTHVHVQRLQVGRSPVFVSKRRSAAHTAHSPPRAAVGRFTADSSSSSMASAARKAKLEQQAEVARREKERQEFKAAQELESLRRTFKRINKKGDGKISSVDLLDVRARPSSHRACSRLRARRCSGAQIACQANLFLHFRARRN